MGQYYRVVNVDRKQMLCPYDFDNGAKLMEWSYCKNLLVIVLMNLMTSLWAGERVYVVGDYADLSDPKEPCHESLKRVLAELGTDDLYGYAEEHFQKICTPAGQKYTDNAIAHMQVRGFTEDPGYRFIYNHATRQVIDLKKCPIEWTWYDQEGKSAVVAKVSPLPLLLAMGNGRGGGDYRCDGYKYVGSWCDSVTSIAITKDPLADTEDYEEFAPDFTMQSPLIPWTEEEKEIAKCLAEHSSDIVSA